MASGAIFSPLRWDAWYSAAAGEPAVTTAAVLSTASYRGRAPIHLATSDPLLLAPRISQAIIDAEITAAASSGVKCWPYLMYGSGSSPYAPDLTAGMMLALAAHRQSSIKNNVNWCMIQQPGLMGRTGNYVTVVNQMVAWMGETNYQTVLSNRPVLYILWSASDLASRFGGSLVNFKAMIDSLRAKAQAAGLGNPYIVVLNGAETTVYTGIGADAIGAYSYEQITPAVLNPAYSLLDAAVQAYWPTLAAQGVPIVPITMSGWNPRPRRERVPPWEASSARPFIGADKCFQDATPAQLAAHLQAAVSYVNTNPSIVPSQLILHYAWNECDEGGGALTPTIGDPTKARLAAVASALA